MTENTFATRAELASLQAIVTAQGQTLDGAVDDLQAAQDEIALLKSFDVPVGAILATGATTAPPHYLMCFAQPLSRNQFATLFAVIGTRYGAGNGSSTFLAPDGRKRALLGAGTGIALGSSGGADSHTLTTTEMPSHTHIADAHGHDVTDPTHVHGSDGGASYREATGYGLYSGTGRGFTDRAMVSGLQSPTTFSGAYVGVLPTTVGIQYSGGGTPFSILNPYVAVNYMIKYEEGGPGVGDGGGAGPQLTDLRDRVVVLESASTEYDHRLDTLETATPADTSKYRGDWVAGTYALGVFTTHLGNLYRSAAAANTKEPGTDNAWLPVVIGVAADQIQGIITRLDTIEDNADALGARVTSAEDDLSSAEGRLDSVEAKTNLGAGGKPVFATLFDSGAWQPRASGGAAIVNFYVDMAGASTTDPTDALAHDIVYKGS